MGDPVIIQINGSCCMQCNDVTTKATTAATGVTTKAATGATTKAASQQLVQQPKQQLQKLL